MQRNKQLETIIVIMSGLVAIYWFKRSGILLWCVFVVGMAAILAPAAAQGIHWFWSKLSQALGAVSGRILLTVVYIFVLLPLSFLARLFSKPGLGLKPGGESYFKQRDHGYVREDMSNPW